MVLWVSQFYCLTIVQVSMVRWDRNWDSGGKSGDGTSKNSDDGFTNRNDALINNKIMV